MELQHHGILGQKWGKKNGPPYPLSRTGDWSASEKKKLRKERKKYARQLQKKLNNATQLQRSTEYAISGNNKRLTKALKKGKEQGNVITPDVAKLVAEGQEFLRWNKEVTFIKNIYLSEAKALGLNIKYHDDDLSPYYKLKVPKE